MTIESIGLGGGCHWCTEAVFQSLFGVENTQQGWIKSAPPHDSFSEAVIVTFNSAEISLSTLLEIHLRTHASQSAHKLRQKYRSAIYTYTDKQAKNCKKILKNLQPRFPHKLIIEVLPFADFTASGKQYQNYYAQNPERPFCKTYIDPKLSLLRKEYSKHINESAR
jgi:peptide-methionine (S)-S-oxide reductase